MTILQKMPSLKSGVVDNYEEETKNSLSKDSSALDMARKFLEMD